EIRPSFAPPRLALRLEASVGNRLRVHPLGRFLGRRPGPPPVLAGPQARGTRTGAAWERRARPGRTIRARREVLASARMIGRGRVSSRLLTHPKGSEMNDR